MSDQKLTERQKLILGLIIQDYTDTIKPVGSAKLVKKYGLSFSSATVRNDMAVLTEQGFLRQPHTSAGRVPTEKGYRYFVRQLMKKPDLPAETKRTIVHQFYQLEPDVERWLRLTASILARQSKAASLVTAPHSTRLEYKHLELISTQGRQVLMVLVLAGGEVRQQMLNLSEPVSQEHLSEVARNLNSLLIDLSYQQIKSLNLQLDALESDIFRLIVQDMDRICQVRTGEVYRDGLANVLAEPELKENNLAQNALKILEEHSVLDELLASTALLKDESGVQVLIGGEGNWEELKNFSMVLSRYGVPGIAMGTLGVLGPIRMSYSRTISTVQFMADLLSDFINENFGSAV